MFKVGYFFNIISTREQENKTTMLSHFFVFLSLASYKIFVGGFYMILKDKEVINLLKSIERKLDTVIAMKKTDKIKQAIKNKNGGKENV